MGTSSSEKLGSATTPPNRTRSDPVAFGKIRVIRDQALCDRRENPEHVMFVTVTA
jgi:hypothetical protein